MKNTKKKAPRVADRIREGLLEAIAFERGEGMGATVHGVLVTARHAEAKAPPAFKRSRIIDLRTKRLRLSQAVFASALNVSPETVRAWEQGKNTPGGPALRLLEIAEEQPELVLKRIRVNAPSASRKAVVASLNYTSVGKRMVAGGK